MANLKDSQTIQNLINSFAGESQARNRYTMFAGVANKEGYNQVAQVFLETAENERLHAKEFYNRIALYLGENRCEKFTVKASYPVTLGDTYNNLLAAADGEHEEFVVLYKEAGEVADKEGFGEIAALFRNIGKVEDEHEKRYRKLAARVKNGTFFKRDHEVEWKCSKCGHVHRGTEAPKMCPICKHPQPYFEERIANY